MIKAPLHILHVEDNPVDALMLKTCLKREGVICEITRVSENERFRVALGSENLDLIVSDSSMPEFDGLSALEMAREKRPEVPFIFLSGSIGEDRAVQALKEGATDYVLKGQIARMPAAIERALVEMENSQARKRDDAAVRASEEGFRLLLESVVDYSIVMLDPEGRIISWNAGAQRTKGYAAQEIIGKHFRAFHCPEDIEHGKAEEELKTTLAKGRFEEEGWRIKKDGTRLWANVVITTIRDGTGLLRGFSKVTRDLTQRKRAEEDLLEIQQRLARAESFSQVMVSHIGLDGRWLKVPSLLCVTLGYTEAEMLALTIQAVTCPADAQTDWKQYELLLTSDLKFFHSDKRYQTKTGEIVHVNVSTSLVSDRQGRPVHYLTYSRDITENVLAHEKVRAQAELLNLTKDAIWICDLGGKILYWNNGAGNLYGWGENEAISQNAVVLLYQTEDLPFKYSLEQTLATGHWSGDLSRIGKQMQKLVVDSRWSLIRDSAGLPKSVLVVESDITEKKRMEAESLRNQRVQSIGAMAGGLAHDLNNSLTPVLIGLSFLNDEPLSPDGKKMLEVMRKSVKHGAEMVSQILAFSRGIGGQQSIVNLKGLVEDMVAQTKKTFPRSIVVEASIADNLHPVKGNATQLHQVILNLCVNARDAMALGGTLTIKAANVRLDAASLPTGNGFDPGVYVLLSIADTGCGIPAQYLDKIFEPFFTTKELGEGTGLGLSTVFGIVKTHFGFLKVTSEVGSGTTFQVYLPAEITEPAVSV